MSLPEYLNNGDGRGSALLRDAVQISLVSLVSRIVKIKQVSHWADDFWRGAVVFHLTFSISFNMDTSQLLGLLFRWLHIIPMAVLVGGTIFMRLALVPASNETDGAAEFREAIRRRWAKWVGISVLFLLVSGLYNAVTNIMAFDLPSTYHMLVMVKLALGFVVFFIAALLSGRSEKAQKLREQEMKWLNILCAIMLILILIAGYMKFLATGATVKDRTLNGKTTSSVGREIEPIVDSSFKCFDCN